jgi:hypothetical protein
LCPPTTSASTWPSSSTSSSSTSSKHSSPAVCLWSVPLLLLRLCGDRLRGLTSNPN